MSSVILYQLEGLPVSVIRPCTDLLPIEIIGAKDVPDGVPFWIVSEKEIPEDRNLRNSWEIDESQSPKPSGIGDTKAYLKWLEGQEESSDKN